MSEVLYTYSSINELIPIFSLCASPQGQWHHMFYIVHFYASQFSGIVQGEKSWASYPVEAKPPCNRIFIS